MPTSEEFRVPDRRVAAGCTGRDEGLSTAKAWPRRWSPARILRRLKGSSGGQAGDGREQALVAHVLASTARGDLDAVISAIDQFAYQQAFLINVGDEKGEILDAAVHATQPSRLLELGTYCGYSALRIARVMPAGAHLWSVEQDTRNAGVATQIWQHAGVGDRLSCVAGALGDDGRTMERLSGEHGFATANLDLVFIDHAKDQYLPDLRRILDRGWLHAGSVVVADNVKVPGAPAYHRYLREREGIDWRSTEHPTHLEYQQEIADLVLESEYLGGGG
jgi:catechol O-methyltransferase